MSTLYVVLLETDDSDAPTICEMYNGFTMTTSILAEAERECREYSALFPDAVYRVAQITPLEE